MHALPTYLMVAGLFLMASAAAQPLVVTTIKPLTLIAADIGGADIELVQLLPDKTSPHDHALKVSDRRLLSSADLVIWVGPSLEGFVGKIILPTQASLQFEQIEGISWPHLEGQVDDHQHSEADNHSERDPHLWLNLDNASLVAEQIANWLSINDPRNAENYNQRLLQFNRQLTALEQQLQLQFETLAAVDQARAFVVQHAAYDHFVEHYNLPQLGSLRTVSGAKVGARSLSVLVDDQLNLACIFTDPQFDPRPATIFSDSTGVQVVELDPLATEIALSDNSQGYAEFMRYFSRQFATCFQ